VTPAEELLNEGERLARGRSIRALNARNGGHASTEFVMASRRLRELIEAVHATRTIIDESRYPHLASEVRKFKKSLRQ
jgi:hypothetical protein